MSRQSKINSHKLDIIHAEIGLVFKMMTEHALGVRAVVTGRLEVAEKYLKEVNMTIDEMNEIRESYAKLYEFENEGGE